MWDQNIKQTKNLIDADTRIVVSRKGRCREDEEGELCETSYKVTEGDLTSSGAHTIEYTDVLLSVVLLKFTKCY